MPRSKAQRDELINDLTVYTKLLNESEHSSRSFENVYEVLTEPEYRVSLHTFALVLGLVPLTPFQQEQLSKIQKLVDWTFPHVPDFAAFSALWHLVCLEDDSDVQVEADDESTTVAAVRILLCVDDEELIEALDHDCVVVRCAAAIAGSSAEFEEALVSRNHLQLEHAIFFGVDADEYIHSPKLKDEFLLMLENFSGNNEDVHYLETYPYTSTECNCIPGWEAIENYFTSLQFFWLDGQASFDSHLSSKHFAFWSTKQNSDVDDPLRFEEPDFFSLALPTKYRRFYQVQLALGPLVISFMTIPGFPRGDWDSWLNNWDQRIDMIQSFLERLSAAVEIDFAQKKMREFVWEYREQFAPDGEIEIHHRILKINNTKDAYQTIEPVDFESGFSYLRNELFGI